MKVTVVGPGAIGQVYGVVLAVAGEEVAFVGRGRVGGPLVVERVNGDGRRDEIALPTVGTVPSDSDVILLATQWGDAEVASSSGTAPVVRLGSHLGPDELGSALGDRCVAAMPGVTAYRRPDGVVRYWVPRAGMTRLADFSRARELMSALARVGLPARVDARVAGDKAAALASITPALLAAVAFGGVDATVARGLRDVTDAVREGRDVAARLGSPPAFAESLARWLGPVSARVGLALARQASPEPLRYVETFAERHRRELVKLGEALVREADVRGLSRGAIARLVEAAARAA